MTVPRSWVEDELRGVPSVLADVVTDGLDRHPDPLTASVRLLEESVAQGSSRTGAWPLLGADSLVTYLCAHALEVDEAPEPRFAELFRLYLDGS